MEALNLTLDTVSVPVTLTGEDGTEALFELREMSGAKRDKYLNTMKSKVNTKDQTLKDFTGSQSTLIASCLFDLATTKPVPQSLVDSWPARVQLSLYEAAAELNKLNGKQEEVDEEEEAKND